MLNRIAVIADTVAPFTVTFAADLARRTGATLLLYGDSRRDSPFVNHVPDAPSGEHYSQALHAIAESLPVHCEVVLEYAGLHGPLLDFFREQKIDLAVMGHDSIGWWTRITHSDPTGQASRKAEIPVLAVGTTTGAHGRQTKGIRTVLVAAANRTELGPALEYADSLTGPDASLYLVDAEAEAFRATRSCAEVASRQDRWGKLKTIKAAGSLAEASMVAARAVDADLIVVASGTHDTLFERFMGHPADALLSETLHRSVLAFPPPVIGDAPKQPESRFPTRRPSA